MRKLLLIALSMGIGTMSFAQMSMSVDSISSPTGTVILQDPANGTTTLSIVVTNNDTVDYDRYVTYLMEVTLDGTKLSQPAGGISWNANHATGIKAGISETITLTQVMGFEGNAGMRNLCVKITEAFVNGMQLTNNDANKEKCETLMFDYPASVADIQSSEISKIITEGGLMKVYINNAGNSTLIKVMNITGQMVKTVHASTRNQEYVEHIDVSDLNPGVYIVTIESDNGTASAKKVFIQ